MAIGIWVLGDQLWLEQAALVSCTEQISTTPVLLVESWQLAQQRRYHRQKLVLVWSAMRHFAEELRQKGWPVTYEVTEDFATPLKQWIRQNQITELRVMEPADRPFANFLTGLTFDCELTWIPNNHFIWSIEAFSSWTQGRKRLLLESFYREGRKRFNILMIGKAPVGGQWNFDKANRKPPKKDLNPPAPLEFEPDAITQAVIAKVEAADIPLFGELQPFRWAVTGTQAAQVLQNFTTVRLKTFGPYQDSMLTGEDTLWHALLSPYLNLGLLQPLAVITTVEQAYQRDDLPLNSVEGFIRQILGWREYIRGVYHVVEEGYCDRNYFNHTAPLPDFFWTAETPMNCLHQTLTQVIRRGYAHHIQRLMILSNFALIAGLSPQAVESWFHAAFIDAYDWVMQPNVIGMGLFADGGTLATKPYAASANYIQRMSDYCQNCQYDPKIRVGEQACPFNFFYWNFLTRHRSKLQAQGRMAFIFANLDKLSEAEKTAIEVAAIAWHQQHGSAQG